MHRMEHETAARLQTQNQELAASVAQLRTQLQEVRPASLRIVQRSKTLAVWVVHVDGCCSGAGAGGHCGGPGSA
jgi:uncharacterized protein (DUF3084 family)